jgi:hypothetical protein
MTRGAMKILHILAESDADAFFYESLAEAATGQSFHPAGDFKLRPGSGWKSVLSNVRLLLRRFPKTTPLPEVAIILAIDNDRSPGHPGGVEPAASLPKRDRQKGRRWHELKEAIHSVWGADKAKWPLDLAVAMPVEMLESWVLVLLDPSRAPLPLFSRACDQRAREYHGGPPPPQLKDLVDDELDQQGVDRLELLHKAAKSYLAPAGERSASLRMFLDELRAWQPAL